MPDIPTDLLAAHEALIQFLHRVPVGMVQIALDGSVEMMNPMAVNLLLPVSADVGLDNLFEVLEPLVPQLRALCAAVTGPYGLVCEGLRLALAPTLAAPPTARRATGAPEVLSLSVMKLDAMRLMAVLSDVTLEVRRERSVLDHAARTDSLTKIPNRSAVHERIAHALALARSRTRSQSQSTQGTAASAGFAVFFMNCDRFNLINDSLGHAAGDAVLGLVAQRLRSELRTRNRTHPGAGSGPVAARNGGDEFIVFLDDLYQPGDALAVARRLLVALDKPYAIGDHQVHCSVSMGIVMQAQAGIDADAVLRDARTAMVEAKRAGGAGSVVFEPAMQERAARRGELEFDLRQAIAKREFFVVYQPIINLQPPASDAAGAEVHGAGLNLHDTGCAGVNLHDTGCAGVEALVRWQHPEHGLLPAGAFLEAAEQTDLINDLGEFVLRRACTQVAAWAGPSLTLAVNISGRQLADSGLADTIDRILAETGLAPGRLVLEITETAVLQDLSTARQTLARCRARGIRVSIDDFGTGFAGYQYLRELPVDEIKIDRSFTAGLAADGLDAAIVSGIIHLAHRLGVRTTAEGIETEEQARLLTELGCDQGQGFLWSAAQPGGIPPVVP